MASIKIVFDKKTGRLSMEGLGFFGETCMSATSDLKQRMGLGGGEVELKAEFFEAEEEREAQRG